MPFTPSCSERRCGGGRRLAMEALLWDTSPATATSALPPDCDGQPELMSDTVGFVGIEDSNDSFLQFATASPSLAPPAAPTFDDSRDSMDWEPARQRDDCDDAVCAVAFRSSPSEPAVRCQGTSMAKPASRLQSAPPPLPTTSSGRRATGKRQSPGSSMETDGAAAESGGSADGSGTPKRRRFARPLGDLTNNPTPTFARNLLHRCVSDYACGGTSPTVPAAAALDTARIDRAIASIDSLNLIGNSEQEHSLPTVEELNYGIRHVTGATVSGLVNGAFAGSVRSYAIVDCRYPYEFLGGHIQGALNIYTQEELLAHVFEPVRTAAVAGHPAPRPLLIFHCEFSSERAPKLARFLRQRDREANATNYPDLFFPEVYVLQGGYKAFFEAHKCDCEPLSYVKMVDPGFKSELVHFQRAGKAWERQNSRTRHTQLERMSAVDKLF